jgi:hypothetical protein
VFPATTQPFPAPPADSFPYMEAQISDSDIWLALLLELNGEWNNDEWVCACFRDFSPYIYSPPTQRWQ